MGLAIELHAIARFELAAPLGFLEPVHPHLTALDALFGLATGEGQALPFEELIEADRFSRWGGGQKSADSLPRCSHPLRPASGGFCRC
jgi:hypothetical protein